MSAKDTVGNFGVGPSGGFSPDYYKAQPNEKPTCAYDDVITFTQATSNSVTMNDNNQGSSFIIGAATGFYGQSGGDGCYVVVPAEQKRSDFQPPIPAQILLILQVLFLRSRHRPCGFWHRGSNLPGNFNYATRDGFT